MSDPLAFDFAGERWLASPEGALYWPRQSVLLVADLHMEKASFFAAHGQPLPPYDSRETMTRLERVVARWGPAEIWCLGDSFHDPSGQARLDPVAEAMLVRLAEGRRWLFIAGNHDGLPDGRWGASSVEERHCAGLVFRHIHDPADPRPQVSGHFHPKVRIVGAGRSIRRPCFVQAECALILPAFGSLTGGLDVDDPAIAEMIGGPFDALVPTVTALARFPRLAVAKMSQQRGEIA